MTRSISLTAVPATRENVADYGHFIGENVSESRLPIPFYDHVDEGENIPFEYHGKAVLRTARIHPTKKPCVWMERHIRMTQFFIGLGQSQFALVLGKPEDTDNGGSPVPIPEELVCFRFQPGTGLLLKKGTWHDFPLAINSPVTCITGNSEEVVDALVQMTEPGEMDQGDVYKIDLAARLGVEIMVGFEDE